MRFLCTLFALFLISCGGQSAEVYSTEVSACMEFAQRAETRYSGEEFYEKVPDNEAVCQCAYDVARTDLASELANPSATLLEILEKVRNINEFDFYGGGSLDALESNEAEIFEIYAISYQECFRN